MMVHGSVDWLVPEDMPPVHQAVIATPDDAGEVSFHVMPYSVETKDPVLVDNAYLYVIFPDGSYLKSTAPVTPGTTNKICEVEVMYRDGTRPGDACYVFSFPASDFKPVDAVKLAFGFHHDGAWQVEYYNAASHGMLHNELESGNRDFSGADGANFGWASPFLIETAVPLASV